MKYPSEKPMVPIRLTAIAAEDDMGVLVWVVNDQLGRAIPENYLHVIPNYTRLDWFSGPANAYGSYQTLVTEAMDESGGQGFATDFSGTVDQDLFNNLTSPDTITSNLAVLDAETNDAEFLSRSIQLSTNFSAALAGLQSILPLPEGYDTNLYFQPTVMETVFTPTELSTARIDMRNFIVTRELEPLQNSVNLVPVGSDITRLYTTLSADEMTLDPTFNYNNSMPDQARVREALLKASCNNDVSNWTLTLGAGTGREGELVLDVTGQPIPFFGQGVPEPVNAQPAAFERQNTSADAEPETLFQANILPLVIDAEGNVDPSSIAADTSSSSSSGFFCAVGPIGLSIIGLALVARRRRTQA